MESNNTVKITLLIEPHYIPSIAFFCACLKYDNICLEQYANFQRSSYVNRTYIAGANGKQRLSIPLKGGSRQKCLIKDVQIDFTENWSKEHWFAIQSAYARAAFFEYYEADIKNFYINIPTSLLEWNLQWINWIFKQLNEPFQFKLTSKYFKNEDLNTTILDKRNKIRPNVSSDELLGIKVKYYQLFQEKHGFQKNLSVLDLLMSTGPEAASLLKAAVL